MKSYKSIEEWAKEWNQIDDEFWKEFNKNIENFMEKIEKLNKKSNNNAPKSIKGDYNLSIHGNKIVLVDNTDGTTVEARCHPHDNFDIGEGMKEAFKKLNEKREETNKRIEVGDWVEIADKEQQYYFYWEWLPNDKFSMVKNFAYGEEPYDRFFKVMYIGKHKELDRDLAFIQDTNGKCYTFNLSGLKKVVKP